MQGFQKINRNFRNIPMKVSPKIIHWVACTGATWGCVGWTGRGGTRGCRRSSVLTFEHPVVLPVDFDFGADLISASLSKGDMPVQVSRWLKGAK